LLGEIRINQRKCHTLKCEVPCCEPGIFPFVRYRHDVGSDEVPPGAVTTLLAALRRPWLRLIAVEPTVNGKTIELRTPEHAGEGLTLHSARVLIGDRRLHACIETVGFGDAVGEDAIKLDEGIRGTVPGGEPYSKADDVAGRNCPRVEASHLGALPDGVHRLATTVDDIVMKRILEMAAALGRPEQTREIGLIVAEQQTIRRLELDPILPKLVVLREHPAIALIRQGWLAYSA